MTNEEIAQVNTYIANLQAVHAKELAVQTRARVIAQRESIEMGQAVHEIRKLCKAHGPTATAEQIAAYAKQIIDRYCPDCDIPF